jgi:hypothetical protein
MELRKQFTYKRAFMQLENAFINEKPNPFDEAVSLIWYLENVF